MCGCGVIKLPGKIKLPPHVIIFGFVTRLGILCMEMSMWPSSHAAKLVLVLPFFLLCVCTYSDALLASYKSMYALALRLPTSRDEPYEKLLHGIRETLKSIIALQPQT